MSLDEQTVDVPQSTYEGYSLVLSGAEFITCVKEKLGWDGEVFAVECFLVKDRDWNLVVLVDLNTTVPSEQPVGPFPVPQVFDKDVAYDDNGRYP